MASCCSLAGCQFEEEVVGCWQELGHCVQQAVQAAVAGSRLQGGCLQEEQCHWLQEVVLVVALLLVVAAGLWSQVVVLVVLLLLVLAAGSRSQEVAQVGLLAAGCC